MRASGMFEKVSLTASALPQHGLENLEIQLEYYNPKFIIYTALP